MLIETKHEVRLIQLALSLLDAMELDGEHIRGPGGRSLLFDMDCYSEPEGEDEDEDLVEAGNVRPSKVHECGTSCCLMGYAALAFPEEAKKWRSWVQVSHFLTGAFNWEQVDWSLFLFSVDWPSDPHQAAARVLHLVTASEDDDLPEPEAAEWFYPEMGVVELSKALTAELDKRRVGHATR